jgi:hypothetical protein
MKKLLFSIAFLALATSAAAVGQGLQIFVVDGTSPARDVRVQIGDQRQRTSATGEAVFALKSNGKYTVEGPKSKAEGRVFKDVQTVLILQSENIKLGVNKDNLGEYYNDGGSFDLTLSYDSPLNYPLQIKVVNVPADWKVNIDPVTIKPDTKATIKIIVPKGSKIDSEAIQFIGFYEKQPVAATVPIKLMYKVQDQQTQSKALSVGPSLVTYNIQTTRTYDSFGTMMDTDFDLMVSNDFTTNLSGHVLLRATHEWEPRDTVDSLDLRLANLVYLTGLVNITLGRLDLSSIIQSGQYFGSYLTLGQRRFDGVYLFLPFTLFGTAGIEDSQFKLPPAALSAGFFPNFFSFFPNEKKFDNGFLFLELKLPIPIGTDLLMFALNYSMTTDYAYLKYSPLSGNPALSTNLDYTLSRNYKIYAEFAICNINDVADTTALMTGASAKNLNAFTWGFVDELCFEYQIPLITSSVNPLVGGNVFFPEKAQQQQGSWFAKAVNHFDGLEFTIAATNSVGDFTFARPKPDAFDPNRVFILNDRRTANEVKSIGKTFTSPDYNTISFLFTVGTHF